MKPPAPTHLGSLCKRGHDHMGTGKSVRRDKSHVCVMCEHLHVRGQIPKPPKPDPGDGTGFAVTNGRRPLAGVSERLKKRRGTRRCVSLKGTTYAALQKYAKAHGVSMSSLLDQWVAEELGR